MSSSEDDVQSQRTADPIGRGRGRGGATRGVGRGRKKAAPPLERFMPVLNANPDRFRDAVEQVQRVGRPVVKADWLAIPKELMEPLRMPMVNQFVRCVGESEFRFKPSGEQYVLVGTGNAMPESFRKWIYCMHQVNMAPLNDAVVPVRDQTRLVMSMSKGQRVVGIERRLPNEPPERPAALENMWKTLTPMNSFMSLHQNDTTRVRYARVNAVELTWGLIPVQYEHEGKVIRKVFHVLITIPTPGFNLANFVRERFFNERNRDRKDSSVCNEVCDLLEQVINHEVDINLLRRGLWGGAALNPWTVTDPRERTSVQQILSPFLVMEKMLMLMPGGYCGQRQTSASAPVQTSLVISGFPDVSTPENMETVFREFREVNEHYMVALYEDGIEFAIALGRYRQSPEEEMAHKGVLSDGTEMDYSRLRPDILMELRLNQGYLEFSKQNSFAEAEKLTLPKGVVAVVDYFFFSAGSTSIGRDAFIEAHIGNQHEVVTETAVYQKYKSSSSQSLADFPQAGMRRAQRSAFKTNLGSLRATRVTAETCQLAEDYLFLQFTTMWAGFGMDAWMSDRVQWSAYCIEQVEPTLCEKLSAALGWTLADAPDEAADGLQLVMHEETAFAWFRLNAGLVKLNRTAKANPLNLSLVWAVLCSDVLTHLGLNNETWRWIMYPIMVVAGMGHLRARSEGAHTARSDCPLTAKPNMAGLDEVVIKIYRWCLTFADRLVSCLPQEGLNALLPVKLDRITRPSLEELNAVLFSNGKIYNRPQSSDFMKAYLFDEFFRQEKTLRVEPSAIQGLVTTALPRDGMAGAGVTMKSMESTKRGPREKGASHQLPGMGLYVVLIATNSNPADATISEAMQTLLRGAVVAYPPGAPESKGMKIMTEPRKRKHINDSAMATSGESMPPSDPQDCRHIASLFSVHWMVCRHLGLMNKTDATMWEISKPVREYMDWFKTRAFSLTGLFGQSLDQSNERIFKGYVARAVAACLVCTTAAEIDKHVELRAACLQVLQRMESSALSLYWANMALLNGITHLVDAGLCLVNQMLRFKANTPVLRLPFLLSVLNRDLPLDTQCADFELLRGFLETTAGKGGGGGLAASYVVIEGVGSSADYAQIEHYLQKYFGLNHNSWYTVYKAITECSNKVIDFTNFLDLPDSMLDARFLFRRMGVHYQDSWFTPPGGEWNAGHRYLVSIVEQMGGDRSSPASVGKIWVHITQHLIVNALIGDIHLHSDNTIEMGKNLFALIAATIVPQQAVPTGALVSEIFQFRNEEVAEDVVHVRCPRDYFLRGRKCVQSWRKGRMAELACVLGPHPLEDVMHMHSWFQTHLAHCGRPSDEFYVIPARLIRGAEVVPGRIYPVAGLAGETGTVWVCPGGYNFALLTVDGVEAAVPMCNWQQELEIRDLNVAPLVFRKHAVVYMQGALFVLQERPADFDPDRFAHLPHFCRVRPDMPRNFLTLQGEYLGLADDGGTVSIPWHLAHSRLLPLGAHIAVHKSSFDRSYAQLHVATDTGADHVVGWLRYPDAGEPDDPAHIFIAFRKIARNSTRRNEIEDVDVLGFPIACCALRIDVDGACDDFLYL